MYEVVICTLVLSDYFMLSRNLYNYY